MATLTKTREEAAAGADVAVEPHEARLTEEDVWRCISARSFAVLTCVTPTGEPRSSGVVYKLLGTRLYVAVAAESWKARHVASTGRVAMTITVRRGGVLSLLAPIPPATISFHGKAMVHPPGSPAIDDLLDHLGSLLPRERRRSASVIEIVPEGAFVTYGVGVPLRKMRDPAASRARVPISPR
jgi:hypothetical protein